jgi:sporulation protein YlmC with PRC-barrel domain
MFTYVPAQDELSSNVIGLEVYNEDKKNIGTIKDIALDADGLNSYIVNVGTFLGMGDHYVVVRPSAISFNAKDGKWHAKMNVNADQLKAAPEYKYSSKS